MRMITLLTSLLLLILCVTSGCQKNCRVGIDGAPELRGFRLRMTLGEFRSRFPSVFTNDPDAFGRAVYSIVPTDAPAHAGDRANLADALPNVNLHPELKGVRKIVLTFIDERAAVIRVYYPHDVKWNSAAEFADMTAESLGITDGWEATGQPPDHKSVRCEGFYVRAGIGADRARDDEERLPYVEVGDVSASTRALVREYEKRSDEKMKDEERRKAFRP